MESIWRGYSAKERQEAYAIVDSWVAPSTPAPTVKPAFYAQTLHHVCPENRDIYSRRVGLEWTHGRGWNGAHCIRCARPAPELPKRVEGEGALEHLLHDPDFPVIPYRLIHKCKGARYIWRENYGGSWAEEGANSYQGAQFCKACGVSLPQIPWRRKLWQRRLRRSRPQCQRKELPLLFVLAAVLAVTVIAVRLAMFF